MAGLTGVGGSSETYLDQLVNSYKSTQQTKVNTLDQRKALLESKKTYYNNLNGRLNSLITQMDKLSGTSANDNFKKQSVSSTDETFVTATASGSAQIQDFNVKVNRKASNDILISKSISINDTFGMPAGTNSIEFILNGKTKKVDIELVGDENSEQAMKKIANAINALNSDEDQDNNIAISATYVKDTATTGRLSFNSKETGADNRIKFVDSPIFEKLGLETNNVNSDQDKRKLQSGSAAGYKTEEFSKLDSFFEINGIEITRSSNSISDVIDGVTISLIKIQEADSQVVSLTTAVDTKTVSDFINPVLKSFNDIVAMLNSNKDLRRSDSSVSSLLYNLRDAATSKLGDGTNDGFKYLADVGVTISSNGDLSISNDKLKEALEKNPQGVAELFTSPNGFAAKLNEAISTLKGDDGLLKTRTVSLTNQIEETKKKTESVKIRIEDQANVLRKQYTSYLKLLYEAQGQSSLSGMMSGG